MKVGVARRFVSPPVDVGGKPTNFALHMVTVRTMMQKRALAGVLPPSAPAALRCNSRQNTTIV
jgi:hypothetical protein